MNWCGGNIAEAVALSKQKNAIFVVFVEDDNDLSLEMRTVLNDREVMKRLADTSKFLAITLKSGSTDYTHFAQIYQFVPVPSLFFIGRNGTPLEVVCAGVEAGNLAARMDRIIEEHHKDSPSNKDLKQQSASLLASESAGSSSHAPIPVPVENVAALAQRETESEPAAKVPKMDTEVVCTDGVCVRLPRADGAGSSRTPDPGAEKESVHTELESKESTLSAEEKMERAKALIEAKRKEKEEKEKQLEKEKEKERRSLGQGVAELKRWQADQELKQIQEERKREKMENNLARQKILEQIAQDRAERRARDAPPPVPAPASTPPAQPATSGDGGAHARIQFKLPDGTSHTAHFGADGTLASVQQYVADTLHLPASQFSLWLAFPRRELVESDETLRRLELAPSAALLVLPRRQPAAVTRPTAVGGVIALITQLLSSMILGPSQRLYSWLMSFVVRPPAPGPEPRAGPGAAPSADRAPSTGAVRRRGNVHRLQGEAPDDDNNTWNGNSTQQM